MTAFDFCVLIEETCISAGLGPNTRVEFQSGVTTGPLAGVVFTFDVVAIDQKVRVVLTPRKD